jgi:hypothetical protein
MGMFTDRHVAALAAGPELVRVWGDRVVRGSGKGAESHPLGGVSARVERGADLEKRVTATRLVTMGVFALAAKKRTGGEAYLTIEGPDFFWTITVDPKTQPDAREFAAKVNDLARSLV